jgi:hypothetical protein
MKKLITGHCYQFYILFAASLMFSCTKENSTTVNIEKVNEVLVSKKDPSNKSALFSILNENEKAYLWKTHLEKFLLVSSLNESQKDLLQEAIAFLTPSIFLKSNSEKLTGELAELEFKARRTFSTRNYYIIFELWDSSPDQIDKEISSLPAPGDLGGCYCRSDGWCHLYTGSDLAGCLWNICTPSSGGCGLFGWHDCKGRCNVGVILY